MTTVHCCYIALVLMIIIIIKKKRSIKVRNGRSCFVCVESIKLQKKSPEDPAWEIKVCQRIYPLIPGC